MIDTDKNTEQIEEEDEDDFITITGVVTKSYFEELMDGRECFHDVEWDIQEYDIYAESPHEKVKRLLLLFRELINDMGADEYIEWCNRIGCPDGLEVELKKND